LITCPGQGLNSKLLPGLVNIQKTIEHGPFIVDLPIKNGDFQYIVMLNYQRVMGLIQGDIYR
jgi:hypothetical protein